MATNFPDTSIDNPFVTPPRPWINGDEFDDTANSGLTYYWNDPVWKTKAGDITVPSLNGGQLAGFRNHIINGDFRVAQRGTSGFTNQLEYTLDRWKTRDNNGEAVTVNQMSVDVPGHPQAIRYRATTGAPSGGVDNIIELPNGYTNGAFAPGSTWTLSYWCTQPLSTAVQAQNNSNTEGEQHRATGGDVQTLDTYNTFTRYSRTFTIGTAPFDNAKTCLKIVFTQAVIPADFILTGVQFEPGPVATPFEHRPYGTELALCQRYYQIGRLVWQNYATATGGTTHSTLLQTTMRTTSATVFTSATSGGTINLARLLQGYGRLPSVLQLSTNNTNSGNQVATDFAIQDEL